MLRHSKLFIFLPLVVLLLSSCSMQEELRENSESAVETPSPALLSSALQGVSCSLIGTSYMHNVAVTTNPTTGPANMTNNFPYRLDLQSQPFQVGGPNGVCPCRVKKYRIYFNSQAAANQAQLYTASGQAMNFSGPFSEPTGKPGPYYIEISDRQASAQFFVRFATSTSPPPLLVHAGGYCIIDNIGGINAPYMATSPILVPTEDIGTGDIFEVLYFWPEESEEVSAIPEPE